MFGIAPICGAGLFGNFIELAGAAGAGAADAGGIMLAGGWLAGAAGAGADLELFEPPF